MKYIWCAPKGAGRKLGRLAGIRRVKAPAIFNHTTERDALVINWGNRFPSAGYAAEANCQFLNHPRHIKHASNKLKCFELLSAQRCSTVDWTTDQEVAQGWMNSGKTVYGRKVVDGTQGKGIIVMRPGDPIEPCPLYTKRFTGKYEYRAHVMNRRVVLLQQKRKRNGVEADGTIKNRRAGYVYAVNDIIPIPNSRAVYDDLCRAVHVTGLDFAAIDFIYAPSTGAHKILELNTRPGYSSPTVVEAYTTYFREI